MTEYECYECGSRIVTESTTAGAFELPPQLYCSSGHDAVEMAVVD